MATNICGIAEAVLGTFYVSVVKPVAKVNGPARLTCSCRAISPEATLVL